MSGSTETRPCPVCGRAIVTNHGLSDFNFNAHTRACPKQQAKIQKRERREAEREARRLRKEAEKETRRYNRTNAKAVAVAKANKIGSQVVPGPGQLGFPFQGVHTEVLETGK